MDGSKQIKQYIIVLDHRRHSAVNCKAGGRPGLSSERELNRNSLILEKLPPYGRLFSSSRGELQPLTAHIGAFWAHFFKMFLRFSKKNLRNFFLPFVSKMFFREKLFGKNPSLFTLNFPAMYTHRVRQVLHSTVAGS